MARTEHAAVYSPFVPIDFAAAEREARTRYQQYRDRARRGAVVPAPARRKDSAWAANAARRLRLAQAESF
jgi:hypothetical protein